MASLIGLYSKGDEESKYKMTKSALEWWASHEFNTNIITDDSVVVDDYIDGKVYEIAIKGGFDIDRKNPFFRYPPLQLEYDSREPKLKKSEFVKVEIWEITNNIQALFRHIINGNALIFIPDSTEKKSYEHLSNFHIFSKSIVLNTNEDAVKQSKKIAASAMYAIAKLEPNEKQNQIQHYDTAIAQLRDEFGIEGISKISGIDLEPIEPKKEPPEAEKKPPKTDIPIDWKPKAEELQVKLKNSLIANSNLQSQIAKLKIKAKKDKTKLNTILGELKSEINENTAEIVRAKLAGVGLV